MDLFDDYITPAELTGYVREALADYEQNQFTLAAWLPTRPIDDLDYRFTRGGDGLLSAATFRQFDAPAPFGSRPGVTRVSGELPPISRQLRLSEYDRLRLRASGANEAILSAIYDDARALARQIAARFEVARADALVNGKVTINENGVSAVVDFGRAAGNTVTAGTAWTDLVNADILTDLVNWRDAYIAVNGAAPETTLTSTYVRRLMQRNAKVIAAVAGTQTGRTRVNEAELNELLASEGIPELTINDAQLTSGRIVPQDKVIYLPAAGNPTDPSSSELGATLSGTTSESLEPGYGLEGGEEPGIVAGTYKSQDPVAVFTKAAAIGLPVLANPNLSFAADVA
jgi:hypothetical protein